MRERVTDVTANRPITLSKIAATDIALILDKAARALTPPPPVPPPPVRLVTGDPPPSNKRYPHFDPAVSLSERRATWVAWLKTRKGAKVGPEGIEDLVRLLTEL